MQKKQYPYYLLSLMLIIGTGCSNKYNAEQIRKDHVDEYSDQLNIKTIEIINQYQPLDLNDCIKIAMDNSLSAREAGIQEKLALLEKNVSYSTFLPAVSISYDKTWFDPLPMRKFNGTGIAMQDKDVTDITWNIQLSIFNPVTWVMYSMHKQGYEISKLINEYTRQAIALQIAAQYFRCLSLEKNLLIIESQLEAAKTIYNELQAMLDEGIISDWQAEQGYVMVLARRNELETIKKSINQAKADLLSNMGLSPLADIKLEEQLSMTAPDGSLEDLITDALLNHPSMAISDREVAIEKEKIRAAVTAFLPNLFGFANRVDTSDSHQVFTNYWVGGLSATITLFDGLANVNYYKVAKESYRASELRREQATLTLMIQVIRASDQVEIAEDQLELARQIEQTTQKHLNELQEQYEQGLIQPSQMLSVIAEANKARINAIQANYQYQTCIAMLNNVMGHTQTNFEESMNESE